MLELRKLTASDGIDIYEMLQAIPLEENGLQNKAHGKTFEEFLLWLAAKERESEATELMDGWKVPSTTFWLYDGETPVGFGSVRHFLTDALRKVGGHIGYGIAPAYRGRGYGNEILRLLLIEAKKRGIDRVLVTIHKDNAASRAVALKNGGVIKEETDERVLVWIETK